MPKFLAVQLLFLASSFGQNCIQYGAPTTLSGELSMRDEAGYNQFIALDLGYPICTAPDPRPGLEWEPVQSRVRVVQAGVYGSDGASDALRDRLNRLVGHRVMIKGILFAAQTGYHRTNVQLGVEKIDAVDAGGQQALRSPKVEVRPQAVAAYAVTIHAGRRLVIEVHEAESGRSLTPSDLYVSHWMTGGEVLYVDCRDGYGRSLIRSTEKSGGFCFDGDLCGFSAFPTKPVVLKFRCSRNP
jgi:hypothetical protein